MPLSRVTLSYIINSIPCYGDDIVQFLIPATGTEKWQCYHKLNYNTERPIKSSGAALKASRTEEKAPNYTNNKEHIDLHLKGPKKCQELFTTQCRKIGHGPNASPKVPQGEENSPSLIRNMRHKLTNVELQKCNRNPSCPELDIQSIWSLYNPSCPQNTISARQNNNRCLSIKDIYGWEKILHNWNQVQALTNRAKIHATFQLIKGYYQVTAYLQS